MQNNEGIINAVMSKDYQVILFTNCPPAETFARINRVASWWNRGLTGRSDKLHDAFTVRFGDVHVSTQTIIEFVPGQRVVWRVSDSRLNFIRQQDEWNDTRIAFEVSGGDGQTQVLFTHHGLVPEVECYNSCAQGWDYYLKTSLQAYLDTGHGTPG